jgi:tetratricopeptide (TPR) repeat protein
MKARRGVGRRGSADPVTRLKNRARREEHREHWTKALELYNEAIAVGDAEDSPAIDVSLYNRIGDIHLKLGKREKAVSFYEHYTEQDLHTSAIALCNKVLRILPTRVGIYLHLARLHAATELDADARLHYQRFLVEMEKLGHESEAIEALEDSVRATGDAPALKALLEWIVETGGEEAEGRLKSLRGHAELGQGDVQAVDAAVAALKSWAPADVGPDSIDDIAAELSDPPAATVVTGALDELVAELDDDSLTTSEDDGSDTSSVSLDAEPAVESEPPAPESDPPLPESEPLVSTLEPVLADLADDLDRAPVQDLGDGFGTSEVGSDPISPAVVEADMPAEVVDSLPERERITLPPPFPVQRDLEPPVFDAIGREEPLRAPEPETLEPPVWHYLTRAIVHAPARPESTEAPLTPASWSLFPVEGVAQEPGVGPAARRPHWADSRAPTEGSPATFAFSAVPLLMPDEVEPSSWRIETPTALTSGSHTIEVAPELERVEGAVHESPNGPSMCRFEGEVPEPISAIDQLAPSVPSDLFRSESVTKLDGPVPFELPFEVELEREERPTNGGPSLGELLTALRHGSGAMEVAATGSDSSVTTVPLHFVLTPPALELSEESVLPDVVSAESLGLAGLARPEAGRRVDLDPCERDSIHHAPVTPSTSLQVEEGESSTEESEAVGHGDLARFTEVAEPLAELPRPLQLHGPLIDGAEADCDPFEEQLEIGIRFRGQGELEQAMEAFGLALASPAALADAWSHFVDCRTELETRAVAAAAEAARDVEPVAEPDPDGEPAAAMAEAPPDVGPELEPEPAALEPTVELASELGREPEEKAAELAPERPVEESLPECEAIEGPVEPELPLEPEASEASLEPAPEDELEAIEAAVEEDSEPARPIEPAIEPAPEPAQAAEAPPRPVPAQASIDPVEDPFLKFVQTAPLRALPAAFDELDRRGEHEKAILILDRQLAAQPDDLGLLKQRARIAGQLGRKTEAVDGYLTVAANAESVADIETARWAYGQVLQLEPENGPALAAIEEVGSSETAAISAEARKDAMIDSRFSPSISAGIAATRPPPPPQHTATAPIGVEPEVRPYDGVAGGTEATLDFEKLVSEFRAELAETNVEADTRSRTELGANLKSMGLLDDAIRELQAAIREPEAPPTAYELLGEAFVEKGQARVATRILSRALEEAGRSDREMLGVLYQLGVAYETVNEFQLALDCYERVFSVDIDYKDVKDRINTCARLA